MTQPCEKAEEIMEIKGDVKGLKKTFALIGAIVIVAIGIFQSVVIKLDDSEARADEAEAKVVEKVVEDTEKNSKEIGDLKVVVKEIETNSKNIEKKVDTFIKHQDKKQEEILEAIKKIKD